MNIAKIALMITYLRRAVKYFIWFAFILCITLAVMVALDVVESDPQEMFRNGTRSIWQIAVLFAILSAVYPMSGFAKKEAIIPGELPELRDKLIKLMESKEYVLESEDGQTMTFRLRTGFRRAMKLYEDRLTFFHEPGGFVIEGLRKDVIRIISFLEFKFKDNNEDEYSKS